MKMILLQCITCATLWYSFQHILLTPLKDSSVEMAHMDPTDIIVIPYTLERLSFYVSVVVIVFLALSIKTWYKNPGISILNIVLQILYAAFILFGIFVLCGADPTRHIFHTILSALYVAALAWLTPISNKTTKSNFSVQLSQRLQLQTDILASYRLYGTVLGIIPLQILNILDWGAQVQRWPLPLLIGSTYGWIVGTLVGIIQTQLRTIRQKN
mmetsp:Transcript_20423/g.30307  ORF Transcript_20423/g.30307 Transcript_20423/m.30307 type:complete len:213 (+) Transcript_20423:179-817(+)